MSSSANSSPEKKRRKKEELDVDDLEVILEAHGEHVSHTEEDAQRRRTFRRLKRKQRDEDEGAEEVADFDADDLLMPALEGEVDDDKLFGPSDAGAVAAVTRTSSELDDDEALVTSDDESSDEMDDFIVDKETPEERRQRRKRRRQQRRAREAGRGPAATNKQLQEAREIFGDFAGALMEMEGNEEDRRTVESLQAARAAARTKEGVRVEPEQAKREFRTGRDEALRRLDVPERMAERFGDAAPPRLEPEETLRESEWIYKRLATRRQQRAEELIRLRELRMHRIQSGLEGQHTSAYLSVSDGPAASPAATRAQTVRTIGMVITLMRNDKCEAPFIATQRRDYFVPALSVDDLWAVQELDAEWVAMDRRKRALGAHVRQHAAGQDAAVDEFLSMVHECESEDELGDMINYAHLHILPADSLRTRRPVRSAYYNLCVAEGVQRFAYEFALRPGQFGASLAASMRQTEPPDPPQSPADMAGEFAERHAHLAELASPEKVLRAATNLLAYEVAHDPRVRRQFRVVRAGYVSTAPKPAASVLEPSNPLFYVRRLDARPILQLEPLEMLEIVNAEKEGLVSVRFGLTAGEEDEMVTAMEEFFQSTAVGEHVEEWNSHRRSVLRVAVSRFLKPMILRELRRSLIRDAEDRALLEVEMRARFQLSVAPLDVAASSINDDDDDSSNSDVAVVGVVWVNRDAPAVFAALNRHGELVDSVRVAGLDSEKPGPRAPNIVHKRRAEGFKALEDFYRRHNVADRRAPTVMALGARQYGVLHVRTAVLELVSQLGARDSSVEVVDGKPAELYATSIAAAEEFGAEASPLLVRAVAVARYRLDRTAVLALLFRDQRVLSLTWHRCPLARDRLLAVLEHAAVRVVSNVGVDLNRTFRYRWTRGLLDFVCGLGPRKAEALVERMSKEESGRAVVCSRSELPRLLGVGDEPSVTVFRNAANVLRIGRRYAADYADELNVLDDTRVHPDDYGFARKMAADALEVHVTEENWHHAVADLMRHPQLWDEIDIDAFSTTWEKQYNQHKRLSLHLVREELLSPYKLVRDSDVLSSEDVFDLVTGTDFLTLRVGMLIHARVRRTVPDGLEAETDLGVSALIRADRVTDQGLLTELQLRDIAMAHQEFPCRVLQLLKANFLSSFDVSAGSTLAKPPLVLSSRGSDVADNTRDWLYAQRNEAAGVGLDDRRRRSAAGGARGSGARRVTRKAYLQRRIPHPFFRPFDCPEAVRYLEQMEPGSHAVVIRPSSKSADTITISWLFAEDVVCHLEVSESGRQPGMSVGRILRVDGEEFSDLDEILAMHLEPMIQYAHKITSHRKYRTGGASELDAALQEMSDANSKQIAYVLGFSKDHAGKFELRYRYRNKTRTEYITVRPQGYRFRGQYFETVEAILTWFKKNWKQSRNAPIKSAASNEITHDIRNLDDMDNSAPVFAQQP